MFIGEYKHSIDEKGRMAIPAKFRSALNQAAVITRGLDHCLYIYTAGEWERWSEKVRALPQTKADNRAFQRLMLAGAVDVELDSQGRVLIPEYLRTYAGITKQTIVAGVYDRLEIWDEAKWQEYKTKTEASSDEIAEKLEGLGI
ncbi:MAG: division/cell wall cluster transcriptional repressor MraZ [bacterium]|nr:division/cell wall cluster transcriptional repressor MraZ [bacterium]